MPSLHFRFISPMLQNRFFVLASSYRNCRMRRAKQAKVWRRKKWMNRSGICRGAREWKRFFFFFWLRVDLMVLWQPKAMKLMMMEWKFRFHIPQWWCVSPTSWMDFPSFFFFSDIIWLWLWISKRSLFSRIIFHKFSRRQVTEKEGEGRT